MAKRYTLEQKCLKKLIGSAVLGTRRYNFYFNPHTDPERHDAQRHSLTDGQTMPTADRAALYESVSSYLVVDWSAFSYVRRSLGAE